MKRLAEALDRTRRTRSRIGKEEALATALASIGADPEDADGVALATAARIAAGLALAVGDPRPLGVGWVVFQELATSATGWPSWVIRECARRTGDFGEAFGLLMARVDGAEDRPGLPLREVAALFDALAATGKRELKRARLEAAYARMTPLETKYLTKVFQASLRVGAQGGVLEGAIARAFGRPIEAVRAAGALVTDPGALAVLARDDRLSEAQPSIGRPVSYMLATPLETIASEIAPALHVVEDKIDGVRAQIHKRGNDVTIWARGLERITDSYPEIVDAFRFVPGSVALDGEIVAVMPDMRPRSFLALQSRLRRVSPTAELIAEVPVAFIGYDLLADDEGEHLALPWKDRRARLEAWAGERGPRTCFLLNDARPLDATRTLTEQLDVEFAAARARGHEGLVLKRIDAPYDAGRRGQAWIKVKRAFATLDVVITAAEEGHGKRAGVLSDYTFGVWRGTHGERELVNVGKAYSGLTDEEIDRMTRKLERITNEKWGRVRSVKPEIVLEVGFDGIQRSARHKSGFALRFPRIVRVRDDKRPNEADTLDTVDALFRSQLESGHREVDTAREREAKAKRVRSATKKAAQKKTKKQMSLFGDDDDD